MENGYTWISLVNNISVSFSLYGLVLFYMATEEKLKPFKPFFKFVCVKSIIFFSYWQSFLFNILQMAGLFNHERAAKIYNVIICFEIVIAAVAQSFAFSYEPFVSINEGKSNIFQSIGHVMSVNDEDDVITDAQNTFLHGNKVEYNKELALEETQMDLIMRYDSAFKWNEEDDRQVKVQKDLRRKQQISNIFSRARNVVSKATGYSKTKKRNSDYDKHSPRPKSSTSSKDYSARTFS